jgi:3'-phosphoadenosine 5'-phosphosulfate sulfotransferase (PAPS reductase)/FAD synthetase
METNPYLLDEPFVVSFSGGRTSGFMTTKIVEAFREHRGGWPADTGKIVFSNTGKEREETLQFVQRCEEFWGVPVVWLEYRWEPGRHYFEQVTFETASRKGEPFEQVVRSRNRVPSSFSRFCTIDLKLRTQHRYLKACGWKEYTSAVGLRYDEPRRVAKRLAYKREVSIERTLFGDEEVETGKDPINVGEEAVCPLHEARVTLADVRAFWDAMPFDLALKDGEGNCDLCFLKGAGLLARLIRARPEAADWWEAQEGEGNRFHDNKPSYADLREIAAGKIGLPLLDVLTEEEENGLPCNCTD